jgi:hypothetical protein
MIHPVLEVAERITAAADPRQEHERWSHTKEQALHIADLIPKERLWAADVTNSDGPRQKFR